jgi:hypothetical protein
MYVTNKIFIVFCSMRKQQLSHKFHFVEHRRVLTFRSKQKQEGEKSVVMQIITKQKRMSAQPWREASSDHLTPKLASGTYSEPVTTPKPILVKKFFRAISRVVPEREREREKASSPPPPPPSLSPFFLLSEGRKEGRKGTTRLIARKNFFTRTVLFTGKTSNCVYKLQNLLL